MPQRVAGTNLPLPAPTESKDALDQYAVSQIILIWICLTNAAENIFKRKGPYHSQNRINPKFHQ